MIVRNNSNQPIYNAYIYEILNSNSDKGLDIDNIGADMISFKEVLPPGNTVVDLGFRGSASGNQHDVVGMYFKSSNNVEWNRRGNGTIKQEKYIDKFVKAGYLLHHVP